MYLEALCTIKRKPAFVLIKIAEEEEEEEWRWRLFSGETH